MIVGLENSRDWWTSIPLDDRKQIIALVKWERAQGIKTSYWRWSKQYYTPNVLVWHGDTPLGDLPHEPMWPTTVLTETQEKALLESFEILNPKQKALIKERFFDGSKTKDIAKRHFNGHELSYNSYYHKAMIRLRKWWTGEPVKRGHHAPPLPPRPTMRLPI